MSPELRNALRWIHIVLGAVILGTYLYSPWGNAVSTTDPCRSCRRA